MASTTTGQSRLLGKDLFSIFLNVDYKQMCSWIEMGKSLIIALSLTFDNMFTVSLWSQKHLQCITQTINSLHNCWVCIACCLVWMRDSYDFRWHVLNTCNRDLSTESGWNLHWTEIKHLWSLYLGAKLLRLQPENIRKVSSLETRRLFHSMELEAMVMF